MLTPEVVLLVLGIIIFALISARWPVAGVAIVLFSMQFGQVLKPDIDGRTLLLSLADIGTMLLLFTVVLPCLVQHGLPFPRTPVWRCWIFYLALMFPSILAASNLPRWVAGARIVFQDITIFAACVIAVRTEKHARRLITAVILWGCLTVVVLCANVFFGSSTYAEIIAAKETDVSFARSNYLASILLLVVPLALHAYSVARSGWSRAMLALASVTLIGGVVLTRSRGGTLVLAGYVAVFLLLQQRALARKIILTAAGVFAAWLVLGMFPDLVERTLGTIPNLSDMTADREAVSRISLWQSNFEAFLERPLFGHGLLNTLVQRETSGSEHYMLEPHNYVLQVLAETGAVGFIGFALLWAAVIRFLLAGIRRFGAHWSGGMILGVLGSIATSFAHGLIENNLLTKEFGIVQWIIIGIAVAAINVARRNYDTATGYVWVRVLPAAPGFTSASTGSRPAL